MPKKEVVQDQLDLLKLHPESTYGSLLVSLNDTSGAK
jgi:hypothetical protein